MIVCCADEIDSTQPFVGHWLVRGREQVKVADVDGRAGRALSIISRRGGCWGRVWGDVSVGVGGGCGGRSRGCGSRSRGCGGRSRGGGRSGWHCRMRVGGGSVVWWEG